MGEEVTAIIRELRKRSTIRNVLQHSTLLWNKKARNMIWLLVIWVVNFLHHEHRAEPKKSIYSWNETAWIGSSVKACEISESKQFF